MSNEPKDMNNLQRYTVKKVKPEAGHNVSDYPQGKRSIRTTANSFKAGRDRK